jgi:hypothetical protein
VSDAASRFSSEELGESAGADRYVRREAVTPAKFLPGLTFRPGLGQWAMVNFVNYAPGSRGAAARPRGGANDNRPDGKLNSDLEGDVRTMSRGEVAVIAAWVPHRARASDISCLQVEIFCPPLKTLLALAKQQQTGDQRNTAQLDGD